jgi:hypothetical protein
LWLSDGGVKAVSSEEGVLERFRDTVKAPLLLAPSGLEEVGKGVVI